MAEPPLVDQDPPPVHSSGEELSPERRAELAQLTGDHPDSDAYARPIAANPAKQSPPEGPVAGEY